MRKFSCFLFSFGAALAAVLFFVRRTRWFALEQAKTMSEPAEFVEAGFWASLLLALLALALFALSFRPERRQADEIAEPTPLGREPWVCPRCGNQNPGSESVCAFCGGGRDRPRRDRVCPRCGSVLPPDAETCEICGCRV